jgi:hypothetical protein
MSGYIILPFKPSEWETTSVTLQIDPKRYRKRLIETWPKIVFFEPPTVDYVLFWGLPERLGTPICMGLQKNLQIISMDEAHPEYILWHRSFVPNKHLLYLYDLDKNEILELTDQTIFEDIIKFTGIKLD